MWQCGLWSYISEIQWPWKGKLEYEQCALSIVGKKMSSSGWTEETGLAEPRKTVGICSNQFLQKLKINTRGDIKILCYGTSLSSKITVTQKFLNKKLWLWLLWQNPTNSRVHISSDEVFSKILKKPSIPHSLRWRNFFL